MQKIKVEFNQDEALRPQLRACMSVCVRACTICVCACVCVSTYVSTCACICTYEAACACAYTDACALATAQMSTFAHTHTHAPAPIVISGGLGHLRSQIAVHHRSAIHLGRLDLCCVNVRCCWCNRWSLRLGECYRVGRLFC